MSRPPDLSILVLSDGQFEGACLTLDTALAFAARIVVLERSPDSATPCPRSWHPAPNVEVAHLDWHDDATVGALLDALGGWVLVLGAGERLRGDWASWPTEVPKGADHLVIRVDDLDEIRLAEATAQAQALIGGAGVATSTRRWITARHEPTSYPSDALRGDLAELAAGLDPYRVGFCELVDSVTRLDSTSTEVLRDALEVGYYRDVLERVRAGRDVCIDDDTAPLVTVRIPTYDRGLIIAGAIESALNQTYANIEVLVVGDRCDDKTAAAVLDFDDPRVRFVNLEYRYPYPPAGTDRWYVAGTEAVNAALLLSKGSWIAPCDDDDELTPDHVEILLSAALERRLEFVWSKCRFEQTPGQWGVFGEAPLRHARIAHGSVLYASALRFIRYSPSAYRAGEPGDWNMWKRMHATGVRMGFVDAVTYIHHLDTNRRQRAEAA